MPTMRRLAAGLVSCLTMTCIGGIAQTLQADDARASSQQVLFSVDVVVDESASPLSIREGQTVVQAAAEFSREQGWDEPTRKKLMPQLVKALEDGITEMVGPAIPAGGETPSSFSAAEHPSFESEVTGDSTLSDPLLTLGVSMGEEEERTLFFHAGQDPKDVAVAFCAGNSPPEALDTCSETLSAHILESLGRERPSPSRETQAEQQQRQQQQQLLGERSETQREVDQKETTTTGEPLMRVPLNINGIETVLRIFHGSIAEDLANELCHREEYDFHGSNLDSCFSQIVEIVHRAVRAYGRGGEKRQREQQQRAQTEPFTFKVPVTLAGLQLYAEFRTDERPRESAERFCVPNLPAIESALGIELYEGEHEDDGGDGFQEEGGFVSMGRQSLKEACAMVVEDAIIAVLLGLRERVLEAEMSRQNATDSGDSDNLRWPQPGEAAAETWAATPIVADTMV